MCLLQQENKSFLSGYLLIFHFECVRWLRFWVRDKLSCQPLVGWSREHLASVKLLEWPRGDVQFISLLSSHSVSPALICRLCTLQSVRLCLLFPVFSHLTVPSFPRGSPICPFILSSTVCWITDFKLVYGNQHFPIKSFSRSYMFFLVDRSSWTFPLGVSESQSPFPCFYIVVQIAQTDLAVSYCLDLYSYLC